MGEKRNPVLRTGRGEWESGLGACGEEVVTSDSRQGKCHLDSTAVKWQSSPPPPQGCEVEGKKVGSQEPPPGHQ